MAGRGIRPSNLSLTTEQLQALGGKDLTNLPATPSVTFPPLLTKPAATVTTAAQNYQILWKEGFLNRMRDSPYFLTPKTKTITGSKQRYSDKWKAAENAKTKEKAEFNWQLMPSELQASLAKKRRTALANSESTIKKAKVTDIGARLSELEKKELNEHDTEAPAKANSDSEQEEEEELAMDDEMDEENDYGNSYFDNGEAYNEEEDNLDDGPVY